MIEPSRRPFWRYLITPRGEATNLVLLFLISFIFGLSQLGYLLAQLADFIQGTDKSFLDLASLITRVFACFVCGGLAVHFAREVYVVYLEEK